MMFTDHVIKKLSAYCNGELRGDESRLVAAHLLKCERCHKAYDRIRLGVRLAAQLPPVSAPAEMWSDIEVLLDAQMRPPALKAEPGAWLRKRRSLQWATAAALVLIACASLLVYRRFILQPAPPPCMAWPVTSLAGVPRIDGQRMTRT